MNQKLQELFTTLHDLRVKEDTDKYKSLLTLIKNSPALQSFESNILKLLECPASVLQLVETHIKTEFFKHKQIVNNQSLDSKNTDVLTSQECKDIIEQIKKITGNPRTIIIEGKEEIESASAFSARQKRAQETAIALYDLRSNHFNDVLDGFEAVEGCFPNESFSGLLELHFDRLSKNSSDEEIQEKDPLLDALDALGLRAKFCNSAESTIHTILCSGALGYIPKHGQFGRKVVVASGMTLDDIAPGYISPHDPVEL
jgi:hypothetical protein